MGRYRLPLAALFAWACSGGEAPEDDRALQKRMDKLEADLSAANETIASLSESDTASSARLDDIASQLTALDARVSVLESSAAEMQSSIDSLETSVVLLEPELGALESDLVSTSALVDELQTGLDGVQSALASLDTQLAALESSSSDLGESIEALFEGQAAVASTTFGAFTSITGTDTTVHNLGSITVDPPGPGRLFVVLTGHAIFFGQGRSIDVGIGDSTTALDVSVDIGDLDGTGTLRVESAFAPTATYTTTGAPVTLYALAQGNSTFDTVSVNITPQQLTVLYVPETM